MKLAFLMAASKSSFASPEVVTSRSSTSSDARSPYLRRGSMLTVAGGANEHHSEPETGRDCRGPHLRYEPQAGS